MNKIITILLALLLLPVMAKAQNIVPAKDMFMFGVSFNPLDSTVYFSELQPIEGAHVYKKSKLLYSRNEYSAQLKDYLQNSAGLDKMVTSVSYSPKRNKAEKKFISMKKKFQNKGFIVKHISSADFSLKKVPFDLDEPQNAKATENKEAKKNKEKKQKESKKKKK